MEDFKLENNRKEFRFIGHFNEDQAIIKYRVIGDKQIDLYWTEVPEKLRGKGIGTQLVKKTLDYIKKEKMKVTVNCDFISNFLQKHGKYGKNILTHK